MTNQIPLGKQLKYALQEKEALQEELKDKTLKELDEIGRRLDCAIEEVSELEFLLSEQNHIDLIAKKFHEWTHEMDRAFEEGIFDTGC